MDELLTVAEIEARYPDEWVFLSDHELDANWEIIRGRVLAHSKNRDEVDQKAMELRPTHSAFLFTGGLPEGVAFLL